MARFLILASLLLSVLPLIPEGEQCYTCNPVTVFYLIALHLMLLLATFANNRVLNVLALTLVVFYASRVFVVQIDPSFYTYQLWIPSTEQMAAVMGTLFVISAALILGCYVGGRLGGGYTRRLRILPFARGSEERRFYYLTTAIFIFSQIVLLYLLLTAGIGLPIALQTFSPVLLRYAKIARSFGVFSAAPICWLIVRKPRGFERQFTLFAIVLLIVGNIATLSKVAIITSALPFVLVYYSVGKRIPRKVVRRVAIVTVSGVLFISSAMAVIRSAIDQSVSSGGAVDVGGALSLDIARNVLSFLGRVGSSFDVLSLVVTRQSEFAQYLNFRAELIDMVNNYFPGGLSQVDAPRWATLLMTIGHGAGYENTLLAGTGENITLPGHLYVNFGLGGASLLAFMLMLMMTLIYRYAKTMVTKLYVLSAIIFGISNGGGFLAMIFGYPGFLLWFFFAYMLHKALSVFRAQRRLDGALPMRLGPHTLVGTD